MNSAVVLVVAATLLLCVVLEFATAVLPLVLVIALVKPEDRPALADVLAAADSARRLLLWPELRRAVAARRATTADLPERVLGCDTTSVVGRARNDS